MSSLREGMPPGEAAEGPHGPWRMSGGRGATRCRGRDLLRDLPREASPAEHATGGMKGVPAHGVGARPASHGTGEKGDSKACLMVYG